MIKFRVLPLTMAGASLLLALKVLGLAAYGGYVFRPSSTVASALKMPDASYRPVVSAGASRSKAADQPKVDVPASPQKWDASIGENDSQLDDKDPVTAQYPLDTLLASEDLAPDPIITGSTEGGGHGGGEAAKPAADKADELELPTTGGKPLPVNPPEQQISPAERALLEKLQARRAELDKRAQELDLRENLLKATEQRLEGRVGELKALEAKLAKDEKSGGAEPGGTPGGNGGGQVTQLKDLVVMYESMKPKEAARIFDALDMKVLVPVVRAMNPRKGSDIIAKMTPEVAQRLTVALAHQNRQENSKAAGALPKIESRAQP